MASWRTRKKRSLRLTGPAIERIEAVAQELGVSVNVAADLLLRSDMDPVEAARSVLRADAMAIGLETDAG